MLFQEKSNPNVSKGKNVPKTGPLRGKTEILRRLQLPSSLQMTSTQTFYQMRPCFPQLRTKGKKCCKSLAPVVRLATFFHQRTEKKTTKWGCQNIIQKTATDTPMRNQKRTRRRGKRTKNPNQMFQQNYDKIMNKQSHENTVE